MHMNPYLNPTKTGLALGMFAGGVHVLWLALILLGWAKPLINFILWAHLLFVPFAIKPFDSTAAATLIIVTTIVGFIVGNILARLFNWAHRE